MKWKATLWTLKFIIKDCATGRNLYWWPGSRKSCYLRRQPLCQRRWWNNMTPRKYHWESRGCWQDICCIKWVIGHPFRHTDFILAESGFTTSEFNEGLSTIKVIGMSSFDIIWKSWVHGACTQFGVVNCAECLGNIKCCSYSLFRGTLLIEAFGNLDSYSIVAFLKLCCCVASGKCPSGMKSIKIYWLIIKEGGSGARILHLSVTF